MNLDAVISIQAMPYQFSVRINLIKDNICVRLVGGCKDYDLEYLCHSLQESDCVRTNRNVSLGHLSVVEINADRDVFRAVALLFAV